MYTRCSPVCFRLPVVRAVFGATSSRNPQLLTTQLSMYKVCGRCAFGWPAGGFWATGRFSCSPTRTPKVTVRRNRRYPIREALYTHYKALQSAPAAPTRRKPQRNHPSRQIASAAAAMGGPSTHGQRNKVIIGGWGVRLCLQPRLPLPTAWLLLTAAADC